MYDNGKIKVGGTGGESSSDISAEYNRLAAILRAAKSDP
jgi:hypothetical protein